MDPQVHMAPAFMDRQAQVAHRIVVGDVHRRKSQPARTGQTKCFHPIIQLFQAPHRARHGHNVPPACGKLFGHSRAKPTRGTGDKGDVLGHGGTF